METAGSNLGMASRPYVHISDPAGTTFAGAEPSPAGTTDLCTAHLVGFISGNILDARHTDNPDSLSSDRITKVKFASEPFAGCE